MGYTPETINSRNPINSAWGNKIEQELARRGNYMGVVSTEADLPASPEVGDWYLVLDKGLIYVWNGSKWIKIGGGMMGYEQNILHLDLVETSKNIVNETPSGAVDGTNTTFTLLNPPIWPGTLTLTVDGSTTVTDNGDGTLSDGGSINYDTGQITLASAPSSSISADYHQKVWDGIKYQPVALSEEFPESIEVVFDIVVSAGEVQAVVRIYDMDDTLLIDASPVSIPADGSRHTYKYRFDLSSLSKPNTIVAQLEVMCSSDVSGYQDFAEVRWY